MFSPISLSGGRGLHQPEPKRHLDLELEKFQIGQTIGSFILGREGGSNWANYWQFHFGEGGRVVHRQVDQ